MTTPSDPPRPEDITTDLVEYLVVVVPGPDALTSIGLALRRVVGSSTIRILDLVVVEIDDGGTAHVLEADAVPDLESIRQASTCYGVFLSRHDIDLVSLALQPGHCAVVLVAEDRWARPLAAAVHAVGGEIRAGERIARSRVEAALARAMPPSEGNR